MNFKKSLAYILLSSSLLFLGNKKDFEAECETTSDLKYKSMGFNNKELMSWNSLKGNIFLANEYNKKGLNPSESLLNLASGIFPEKIGKFEDTKKPDAILIYTKKDHSETFIEISHLKLIKEISKNYDISLSVCGNDDDVLEALDKVKKPELILFGGHGNGSIISLGDSVTLNQKIGNKTRNYSFGMTDKKTLKKLSDKSDAVFVLYNCLNGNILAPNIKKKIPNMKIFAAKDTIYTTDYKINSIYPFDISFYNSKGKDCTYKK
jgi:hypothetical protein